MLQSSSPSYLLMASLDDARAYAESYNEEDKINFWKDVMAFMKSLDKIPHLKMIETDDPLKLIVRWKAIRVLNYKSNWKWRGLCGTRGSVSSSFRFAVIER